MNGAAPGSRYICDNGLRIMPEFDDPEVNLSARVFAVGCLLLSWVMLGLASTPTAAAEAGGLLGLVFSTGFLARASFRGVIAGFPLWFMLDEQHNRGVDADLWFAQIMAFIAATLLAVALVVPAAV